MDVHVKERSGNTNQKQNQLIYLLDVGVDWTITKGPHIDKIAQKERNGSGEQFSRNLADSRGRKAEARLAASGIAMGPYARTVLPTVRA